MKIYKFTYNMYDEKVKMYETDIAKETPKTYKINPCSGVWESVINKCDIGVLHDGYNIKMFLLEKDRKTYIEALREYFLQRAETARDNYQKAKDDYLKVKGFK